MLKQLGFILIGTMIVGIALTATAYVSEDNGNWTFTYTVNQANALRIRDAYAETYNYKEQIKNENGEWINNPESKVLFTDRMIQQQIQKTVLRYERRQALQNMDITEPDIE